MNVSEPVCNSSSAEPCREFEPYIDLMKQRSSDIDAMCGKISDAHWPHWPYCLKLYGEATRLPVALETMRGFLPGYGLPVSRCRAGR